MKATELWSFRDQAVARVDLTGFELYALDGSLGKVTDSIEGTGGGYLVVDPGIAMPLGRQLLVPAGLVEKVGVDERRVTVKAQRDQVRSAPEYVADRPLDKRARTLISDYYRPVMAGGGTERARAAAPARASARARAGGARSAGSGRSRSSRTAQSRTSASPTKAELYEQAKRLGIEGRSKMDKSQLARAVGRRRGQTSGGRRSTGKANPVSVQAFLDGVGYPTRKRDLVREAESQGAGREVRSTLRRLPDKTFDSPTEVSEAIGRLN
jgi:hypothetical protein